CEPGMLACRQRKRGEGQDRSQPARKADPARARAAADTAGIFQGPSVLAGGYTVARQGGGTVRKNQGGKPARQNPRSSRSFGSRQYGVRPRSYPLAGRYQIVGE